MNSRLHGTALITGGSSGIGLEYARQLLAKGCNLLLVSNKQDELDAAAELLRHGAGEDQQHANGQEQQRANGEVQQRANGQEQRRANSEEQLRANGEGQRRANSEEQLRANGEEQRLANTAIMTRCQDLALPGAADELFAWCQSEGIEVEVLVSNAGMFFLGELTPDRYAKAKAIVGLHVETPTRLCLLFGNEMKKRGHGVIISMASLAADMPVPGITLYSATKAYLKAFGRAAVHEFRPYGVGMTTVCPGAISTSLYGLRADLMRLAVRIGVIKKPQWLVRRVLRAAEHGRALVQAGPLDRMMGIIIRLTPSHLETRIWKRFR